MPNLNERAKVVNERTDYGEGYDQTRFGFCIGDRIFMVGVEGFGTNDDRARSDRAFVNALVNRWNAPLDQKAAQEFPHD